MLFGSDFGGAQKSSRYLVYSYAVADEVPSNWPAKRSVIRSRYLPNGRRLSFKRLDDSFRRDALVPFLQATDELRGHLVSILVDKRLRHLTSDPETVQPWCKAWQLNATWNKRAFEDMVRKVHFFALCVAEWSRPMSDVTWITDEDEFVANEIRLDDAQKTAAHLCSLYAQHPFRTFAMNSTSIDDQRLSFEDFISIADLAAGMLAEVCSKMGTMDWKSVGAFELWKPLSDKAEVIADWYWFPANSFRRTCIVIDKVGDSIRVMRLQQLRSLY